MIDDEKSYVNQLKKYFSNLLYQILFLESELQNDNINDVSLKSTIKMIKNIVNYYLKKIDDLLQNNDKKYNFKIENIERDIIEMMFNNIDNIQDLLIKHSYEINKNSISNDIINIKLMLIFIKKKLKDIWVNKKYYIQVAYSVAEDKAYEREFKAFNNIDNNSKKILITNDEIDYSTSVIEHIKLKDFLLMSSLDDRR